MNKNESYLTKLDLIGYYWDNSWRVSKGHNIRSCKTKNDGNQEGSTRTNTLGGLWNNKDWSTMWRLG